MLENMFFIFTATQIWKLFVIFLTCIIFACSIISNTLLNYPLLLHSRKQKKETIERNKINVIGHRGSRLDGWPENTIAAFKDAYLNAGADAIELDVWLTNDGEVVVHHDEFLQMDSGVMLSITKVNYKDLPMITNINNYEKVQVSLSSSASSTLSPCNSTEWSTIPTLMQVFEAIPNHIHIIVEFKQNSEDLIVKVHQLIKRFQRQEAVIWFSLSEAINKKLRLYDSSLQNMTSIDRMLEILVFYYVGLLPFMRIPESVYGLPFMEITYETILEEKNFKNLPQFVISLLAYLFQGKPPNILMVPALYRHLRNRGISIFVLGVETPQDVKNVLHIGATAFLTDTPSAFVKYVRDNKIKLTKIAD